MEAARERIQTAQGLLVQSPPDYVGASYFAGVAVECLFYAYLMRSEGNDNAHHDLRLQAVNVGFYKTMTHREQLRVVALLSEVEARWRNNHRYRSETALRRFVTDQKLFVIQGSQTAKQDALQYSTVRLVDTAAQIVEIGIKQWQLLPNL